MDCIHESLQARILQWVAFPFSKGSSQPRDQTQVSHIAGGFFTSRVTGKPKNTGVGSLSLLQWIFPTQELNQGLLHCRWILYPTELSVQLSSVAQSCPTLRDPMNHSTPGLPVHHQLPEFTQTHVHRVSDAIQPSHPVIPFSSCPQSLPASESFPMSQLFA